MFILAQINMTFKYIDAYWMPYLIYDISVSNWYTKHKNES